MAIGDDTDFEPLPLDSGDARQEEMTRLQRLDALAGRLSTEATRLIGLRQSIEERWLRDLRQFDGVYETDVLERIKSNKGSEVFVNITRPKAKTAEARLWDMMFPTDDRNFMIKPTPVPEIAGMINDTRPAAQLGDQTQSVPAKNADGTPQTVGQQARSLREDAIKRAELMQDEIDDQLTEALWPSKTREQIHDAVVLGTGILKGPIVVGRQRQSWQEQRDAQGNVAHILSTVIDPRPGLEVVDPWNFFPDMSATTIDEARFVFERRYLHQGKLEKLKKDPYYLGPQIDRAIKQGAKSSRLTRDPNNEKRENAGAEDTVQSVESDAFELWEYHGPITAEDLMACGIEVSEDEYHKELNGCVVFCAGIVIKAYINPLDTGELPYSVFNFERDEKSIFGFGVPYRLRHSQAVVNAAWRALMDNSGASAKSQVVVNKRKVQAADGDYRIVSGKVWEMTDPNGDVREAFGLFDIPIHQAEFQAIIDTAMRFADEEINQPLITQGEQGPHITKTAQGMSLLSNAANVVLRSTAKNFDDGTIVPTVRRYYDFNMQYSPREEIKGDYEVDARGSSALLSREVQSQNLMTLGMSFSGHPKYGAMLRDYGVMKRIVQSMHLQVDDVMLDEDEYDQVVSQPPPEPPEVQLERSKQEFELKKMEADAALKERLEAARHAQRMKEMEIETQLKILELASSERLTLKEIEASLAGISLKIAGDRTKQVEQAVAEQNPAVNI